MDGECSPYHEWLLPGMEGLAVQIAVIAGSAGAGIVVLLVAALLILRHRLLGASLPKVRGRMACDGVRAPVLVARDRFGVPHVQAASMTDAAFAMGLVHGQDRLWQLEVLRRTALGRVAEIAGTEALPADRFIRRLGLQRVAAAEARTASGEVGRMLDAYAAGVNAAMRSARRLPLEFRLLKITPQPWDAVHTLVTAKLLALGLSLNWDVELQRLDVLRKLGPALAARLEVVYPAANPTILSETAEHAGGEPRDGIAAMFAEAARWIPTAAGASNAWAVAGARTGSGRPILCNDPHLSPSLPSPWYAAHVRAGDDFEATGATFPGLPFIVIGHNRRVAWGFTNSFADAQDLVIEEFDSAAAQRYRTERGFEPTRIVREVIHVRGASDAVEEVVVTRHGPVVERLDDAAHSTWRGLALQWTALTPGGAMESMLRMQRASNWNEFRDALAPLDAPSQNVVYADCDGHIGYALCGRVPVRRRRPSGVPVPGWKGDALWVRFLRQDELPSGLDPPQGAVVTANNRIVGDTFAHYIAEDYMNGYRARRIHELLDGDAHNLVDMARFQMDVLCLPAQHAVRLLSTENGETQRAERVRALLTAWDGRMDADRCEPALYEAFMLALAERALRPLCGDAWETVAGVDRSHPVLGYPGNVAGRLTLWLLEHWERGDNAFFDGATTWRAVVAAALDDAAGRVPGALRGGRASRWGRLHALAADHPFSRPFLLRLVFNAGTMRVGGNLDTVMATGFLPREPFRTRLVAPSWRHVIHVGEWDASGAVLYPGQSGQPGSRHYRDLRRRWARNRQFPMYWSEQQVRRHTRSRLELFPAPR